MRPRPSTSAAVRVSPSSPSSPIGGQLMRSVVPAMFYLQPEVGTAAQRGPPKPTEEMRMRHFSFRPSLTIRGRTFKGLRGWAGKPLHPPLTDIPVGAYMLAATFDVISVIGDDQEWARDFYRAASFCLIAGAAVSL